MIPDEIVTKLRQIPENDLIRNSLPDERIHDYVKKQMQDGTETYTFDLNPLLMAQTRERLEPFGWTLEEAAVLALVYLAAKEEITSDES